MTRVSLAVRAPPGRRSRQNASMSDAVNAHARYSRERDSLAMGGDGVLA